MSSKIAKAAFVAAVVLPFVAVLPQTANAAPCEGPGCPIGSTTGKQYTVQEQTSGTGFRSVTARCEAGDTLLSGAGSWDGDNADYLDREVSEPTGPNAAGQLGWTYGGELQDNGTITVRASVVCVDSAPPSSP